jgi:hypothetical protein
MRPQTVHMERLEPRRLLSNVVPVGPEFLVITSTSPSWYGESTAMDRNGNFVVTWSHWSQVSHGVYAQRYDVGGAAIGSATIVSPQDGADAAVAMNADGDFVVTYCKEYPGNVYARQFDSAGVPKGPEFRVNTSTTGDEICSSVALSATGDFIVVWSDVAWGASPGVFARQFDADGSPKGDQFRVGFLPLLFNGTPDVAYAADGEFIIVWEAGDFIAPGGLEIRARRYDAEGISVGPDIEVNSYTPGWQLNPSIAVDVDGDFVIAWTSNYQDGSGYGVYAQSYSASGVAQGNEFRVNTYTSSRQDAPSVAMDAEGDFVIAWHSNQDGGHYPDGIGVYAQRYNGDGVAQGAEFRVHSYTTGAQGSAAVAMDDDGDFCVTWGGDFAGGYGISAQRFGVVPTVAASSFAYAKAPHKLSFTFDRDVSASLGTVDLLVRNLTTMQSIPASDFMISYDALTNIATFDYTGTTAGIAGMLPDGNYSATLLAAGISTIQGAPLEADYVMNFRFLQGDANGDGRVNLNDFNILAANFGQGPRDFTQGDFDYSGAVNLSDFNILAARFGQVLPAPPAAVRFGSNETEEEEVDQPLLEAVA